MMKVTTVDQMRSLDQRAIEEYGIIEELLMENAGGAAYTLLSQEVGVQSKHFLVFCGVGNNGGDGCVLARLLHANGGDVSVFVLSDPDKFRGTAKLNFDLLAKLPIPVQQVHSLDVVETALAHTDFVVDAIFGTGLSRDVGGIYRDVIETLNASGKPVLSLDIPSGVHGDTGQVMGVAVRADYTVTFGLPKLGNLLYPGFDLGGQLYVSHISFPPALYAENDTLNVAVNAPQNLPRRQPDGHKGTFGKVLFIAGAASYFGAPYFSALSFLKAGGGYSRLAAPTSMTPFLANKGSEIVFVPQQETESGSIAMANKTDLLDLCAQMDMVVLGPGLSLDEETQELARDLAAEITVPLLLDGDGITALCGNLEILSQREAATVLTPHLGEMARITDLSITEINAQKVAVLQNTCEDLNAIIVLKGAHSSIGYPDRRVFVNMSGNSGMASAGSGDVLTGTIAAMYGLGLDIEAAVRQGVFVHGLAGDLAAEAQGKDGVTAQTILDTLPLAMKSLRDDFEALRARYRGAVRI
jgi:NAD(P)H-hydrate epimerase